MLLKKYILFCALIWTSSISLAQNNQQYFIHTIDATDSYTVSYARLTLYNLDHESLMTWNSKENGVVQISEASMNSVSNYRSYLRSYFFKIYVAGYETTRFTLDQLIENDTLVKKLELERYDLGEINIIDSVIPLIDRGDGNYKEPIIPPLPVLDSTREEGEISNVRTYLFEHVSYPRFAIVKSNQGKVHLAFEVDSAGYTQNVTILRGVSESLDIVAKNTIMQIPKMKHLEGFRNDNGLPPGRYRITFYFELE